MEKDATIPAFISFEMKKGKSSGRKSVKKELSPARRASLPAAFGTIEEKKYASQPQRRSTMPQVTAEEKESLPPLNQLALMLMPPKLKQHEEEK